MARIKQQPRLARIANIARIKQARIAFANIAPIKATMLEEQRRISIAPGLYRLIGAVFRLIGAMLPMIRAMVRMIRAMLQTVRAGEGAGSSSGQSDQMGDTFSRPEAAPTDTPARVSN